MTWRRACWPELLTHSLFRGNWSRAFTEDCQGIVSGNAAQDLVPWRISSILRNLNAAVAGPRTLRLRPFALLPNENGRETVTTINSKLAPRMARVQESATSVISAKVRALEAAGRDVINLGEGELDFDTPESICEAGVVAIRSGDTRYSAVGGTDAFRRAAIHKFLHEDSLSFELNEVVAGSGAKQIIFHAILATVSDSDEVIIPTPSWVSYPDIVRLTGGLPHLIRCPAKQGLPTAWSTPLSMTPAEGLSGPVSCWGLVRCPLRFRPNNGSSEGVAVRQG